MTSNSKLHHIYIIPFLKGERGSLHTCTLNNHQNYMASKIAIMAQQSPKDQGSSNNRKMMIDVNTNGSPKGAGPRRQCLCSPTTHKGSFRCRLHRSMPLLYRTKSLPSNPPVTIAGSQAS